LCRVARRRPFEDEDDDEEDDDEDEDSLHRQARTRILRIAPQNGSLER
jgi:hypothetical protein